MSILASVSDVLALLASGVALLAAARALQAARRAVQAPSAASPQPPGSIVRAAKPEPVPATARPATRDSSATAAGKRDGTGTQGRGDALRDQIRAYLAEHDGRDLSLVEVSKGVDRRSATVSYAIDKLIAAGHVELTSPKPRHYAITSAGLGT